MFKIFCPRQNFFVPDKTFFVHAEGRGISLFSLKGRNQNGIWWNQILPHDSRNEKSIIGQQVNQWPFPFFHSFKSIDLNFELKFCFLFSGFGISFGSFCSPLSGFSFSLIGFSILFGGFYFSFSGFSISFGGFFFSFVGLLFHLRFFPKYL